ARVEDHLSLLREQVREVIARERRRLLATGRLLRAVAVLIRDDEIDVAPEAQRAIRREARERGEVVGLGAEPVLVEARDRRALDSRRVEPFERRGARLPHARGLILEPRLVRVDLARLRRARLAVELDERLPPEPGELVVVPHGDEREAGARVLEIGIV